MRASRAAVVLVAAVALAACVNTPPTAVSLQALEPSRGAPGQRVPVVVRGEGFAPSIVVDFQRRDGNRADTGFVATLSDVALEDVHFVSPTEITATVPGTLAVGAHALTVVTPGGLVATLAEAFVVSDGAHDGGAQDGGPLGDGGLGEATALAFAGIPPVAAVGACLGPASVELLAADGGAAARSTPTAVSLSSDPARLSPFADPGCTVASAGLTIPAGTAGGSFFFRGAVAGDAGMVATAAGLQDAVASVVFEAPAPASLVFRTPPRVVALGGCSEALEVELRDQSDQPLPAPAALTVGFAAAPTSLRLFADPACTTLAPSIALGAGATSVTVYASSSASGVATVTASATGLSAARQDVVVDAAPATALLFTTAPQSVVAGSCSGAIGVRVVDAVGQPVAVPSAVPVGLSTAAATGVAFFADAACATPASSVTVAAGTSDAVFYARGTSAGTVSLSILSAGLTGASQPFTITPGAAPVLAFIGLGPTLPAGACDAAQVVTRTALGALLPVASNTVVALTVTPASGVAFYSDAACTTAVTQVTVLSGQSQAGFYARGTVAGGATVSAAATGYTGASQALTVAAGLASALAWAPLSTSVALGVPLAVRVSAVDSYGNVSPTFLGTADLTVTPAGSVSCATACTSATRTASFVGGVWSGTLTLGAPAGTNRRLSASSGALTGLSSAFTTTLVRAPPLARFIATPGIAQTFTTMNFNATTSTDTSTPTSALEVSWDFNSAYAGAPPWIAWTTTKTAAISWNIPGEYTARVAVRDADGDIGYAERRVFAIFGSMSLCAVDTASTVDDGASNCNFPGPDGLLSLPEAVRISNTRSGVQHITFSSAFTITGATLPALTDPVIIAGAGVTLRDVSMSAATPGVVLSGLTFTGANAQLLVPAGGAARVYDTVFDGARELTVTGSLTGERVTFRRCQGTCVRTTAAGSVLHLAHGGFYDSAAQPAVQVPVCPAAGAVWLRSTVFARNTLAARLTCSDNVEVQHNTFADNVNALDLIAGSTGPTIRNNIFTGHTGGVMLTCGGAFVARQDNQLFQNLSDGCLGGQPGNLPADPKYVSPASDDYRLDILSPSKHAAPDRGLDVNGIAPGRFLGTGPDFGGRETW